ncbi:MAG: RNA-binding protein [Candidatus Magasanikbacteria bacterium RIFCSPHIGHO2_02_FULL_51_14]|uniref:RNA-binding protein n=1 Tax=Candidatus Magasanikbacteria bacterium RIFCSPHIGHO2_02_FULL_51_14 TaxID=1798683 RepID=A0A1F6MPS3_9BACT|nr:MAG: RNA-binding protein [Candidatus Magasanikbacteria bacterium RIFCSPHIGHO2_02_FULL_51_14]
MAQKLFVGNLPYTTTDDDLRNLFAQAGTVQSANVVLDKMTGRSRGFGFVEMSSDEEAQNAIQTLNGHDLGGRQITVNEARPMESRPRGGGGYRGGGGGGGRSDW